MPFKPDPEVSAALVALAGGQEPPPPLALGDWQQRRQRVKIMFALMPVPPVTDVDTKDHYAIAPDGAKILCRWYTKKVQTIKDSPAVLYLHGGGYIAGDLEDYKNIIANYVSTSGVPFLAVEYRLAPEVQYPGNVDDAFRGLVWLHDNAANLGVDKTRIAVMGDSGGGGLAAALTHYNLEQKGPELAKQILIYPMLDDRNIQLDPHLKGLGAPWTEVDNETGWTCILGSKRGTPGLPPSAAPARMTDATGLPPMYIDFGELDIFRDESLEYTSKFVKAGISVEMHLWPGCVHGFEYVAPSSKVAEKAIALRIQAINSIESVASALKL